MIDHPHLTQKQKKTYDYIKEYFMRYGISPTEREIAEGIGILSRGSAHRIVHSLEKKELISRVEGKRRNIVLNKEYLKKSHDLIDYAAFMFYLVMLSMAAKENGVNDEK